MIPEIEELLGPTRVQKEGEENNKIYKHSSLIYLHASTFFSGKNLLYRDAFWASSSHRYLTSNEKDWDELQRPILKGAVTQIVDGPSHKRLRGSASG